MAAASALYYRLVLHTRSCLMFDAGNVRTAR
jgi:hypothetical protein